MNLVSRRNKLDEEKELADFATECAKLGVFGCVKSVFYDSGAEVAVIETHGVLSDSTTGMRIRHAAERCFTQYEADGVTYHRIDCDCAQCAGDFSGGAK
ncbi:MAG: hypothetical protein KBA28_09700 [Syntrophaceae bacterium]|jgi:hypothetical protein|nr:hypothetical protein [Syntrophaceae bacterium]